MRRLILVFLMCLLPLQWSWAAAASVCAHESGNAHFGHHEHRHQADATDAAEDSHDTGDTGASHELPGKHPDCQVCHGMGAAFLQSADAAQGLWATRGAWPAYRGVLPEPPVESLLRPPLTLVA